MQAELLLIGATAALDMLNKILGGNLCKLTASSFEKAVAEKVQCQDDVNQPTKTIELAEVLVKGLEYIYILLVILKGMEERGVRKTSKVPVPMMEGLDPIATLTDDATTTTWSNKGLPADRMSAENATILTHCKCCFFMIDPQQQGIK
ncbi:dynein axonemal heavy chain 11 [Anser cygnoides]|uniref:dynein axonemal heavy chain 11 n=1 Tax=Anser cygnoides TaxID=8845 RepID=UPI0034D289BD